MCSNAVEKKKNKQDIQMYKYKLRKSNMNS